MPTKQQLKSAKSILEGLEPDLFEHEDKSWSEYDLDGELVHEYIDD